ncbi:MAG TPA: DUF5916 domain-containing protein [Gemmatimonadaceae bacterium]|nr:DUF5916 domain-containing protein [Gemmatimonadaceae bacterium]
MLALALALLQSAASDSAARDSVLGAGAPTFTVPRLEAELRVDGELDEPAWARAARLTGFHGYEPSDQRPAEERTEVLVWYSPTAIHFGIRAHDTRPASVRATLADRDNIDEEDRVTILLDTFDDARRAFLFAVNPLGVQQDGVRSEGSATAGNPFGGSTDLSPDYTWQSAGRRTPWGWQAEVRIPFKSLRYASGDEQRWGIQLLRDVQRTGHQDTWTDARRGSASFLGQSGTMVGLHDLRHGVVLEAQPFVTASSRAARDGETGRLERGDPETSAGVNARFGFANAAIDATINPDFSQVESDAGLVTANERFELFVDEKRPFFLEGIELFASPNQLVYTRRIVEPVAGAKLTGKWGPWGVAYLSAVDEDRDTGHDPLFNVLRVRRDVGAGSVVGATLTDRRVGGDRANTVAAADARIVFGGKYYFEAQGGGSRTDPPAGGAARTGRFWSAEVDRTGRNFGFNYSVESFDDAFDTEAGFIPRVGVLTAHVFNRFTWYGQPGGRVESVTTFFGPEYLWRDGALGDGPIEGNEFVNTTLRLRGGWELGARVARDFVDFLPEAYAGLATSPAPGVFVPFRPSGGLRGLLSTSLELTTPVFQRFTADASLEAGEAPLFAEAGEGRRRRAELGLSVRPTTQLRGELSAVWQRLTRERDGSEFARTVIPRLRVEYQPTRALFFRLVGEYQADRRTAPRDPASGAPLHADGVALPAFEHNGLRLEWLASYEPTPGTVAFLGYAVDLTEPDPLALRQLRAEGDGLFVKLAYQFRR